MRPRDASDVRQSSTSPRRQIGNFAAAVTSTTVRTCCGSAAGRRLSARLRGERLVRSRGAEGHAPEIVDRLNKAVNEILADPKARRALQKSGHSATGSAADFGKLVADETRNGARWSSSPARRWTSRSAGVAAAWLTPSRPYRDQQDDARQDIKRHHQVHAVGVVAGVLRDNPLIDGMTAGRGAPAVISAIPAAAPRRQIFGDEGENSGVAAQFRSPRMKAQRSIRPGVLQQGRDPQADRATTTQAAKCQRRS